MAHQPEQINGKKRKPTELSPAERLLVRRIGVRIGAMREARNITQKKMSEKAQISKNLASLVETSAIVPSIATLWRIAQALDLKLSELLDIDDPPIDPRPRMRLHKPRKKD